MKKLLNEPERYTDEMIEGLLAANPDSLRQLEDTRVILRAAAPVAGKVGIVTGGGTGHEPASSGLVGPGMLDGVTLGDVFTAPPADGISEMIPECDGCEGVLAVIGNYDGDIMNFEAAMEIVEAEHDIDTETVVVADDVATRSTSGGARGVCGMVLVHKVAGAKAMQDASLKEVATTTRKAADRVATMGVGLTSCVTPQKGTPTIDLGPDEMEVGIGNHGEPGVERTELMDADDVTDRLTDAVLADLDIESGARVATMVNGMGATPLGELYIVNRRLQTLLSDRDITTEQAWVGEYTTSLDMAGCSIVVMELDDELASLINAPADSPGLTVAGNQAESHE